MRPKKKIKIKSQKKIANTTDANLTRQVQQKVCKRCGRGRGRGAAPRWWQPWQRRMRVRRLVFDSPVFFRSHSAGFTRFSTPGGGREPFRNGGPLSPAMGTRRARCSGRGGRSVVIRLIFFLIRNVVKLDLEVDGGEWIFF